ncbi:reverse transcriptase-rnase h-integrase [Moniliophthora roreri]|nr:reverse transcriptase-rnase h-integrase [Moniliophthora roreri]
MLPAVFGLLRSSSPQKAPKFDQTCSVAGCRQDTKPVEELIDEPYTPLSRTYCCLPFSHFSVILILEFSFRAS